VRGEKRAERDEVGAEGEGAAVGLLDVVFLRGDEIASLLGDAIWGTLVKVFSKNVVLEIHWIMLRAWEKPLLATA
jgi:hypothetical protein